MKAAPEVIELPDIPSKRYFTIGEVSELCAVKPHVLRYWEQEFAQLKPIKRRGNRRYYQQDDVLMVRSIRNLLYEQGFTITGARQRLKELNKGVGGAAANDPAHTEEPQTISHSPRRKRELREIRNELEELLSRWPD